MPSADERQLILDVKDGNHDAFRILVERYMKHAYNVAYGFVSDHDEAEDIAQDSFVRIYQSIRSFRGDAEFSTWLYRIVMNASLNKLKQRKNRSQRETPLHKSFTLIPQMVMTHSLQPDVRNHIERALHELPTLQRAVVILRHVNGLSTKQVSSILRCSEGTVKTHLHRGIKKMKRLLSFLDEED